MTPDVPLLFKTCFAKRIVEGYDDPEQDVALLHFLYHNHHLPGISEATVERVDQESQNFHIKYCDTRPT